MACGGLASVVSYARADTIERRRAKVGLYGIVRFFRSLSVGLVISLDYWWAGRGLDEVRNKGFMLAPVMCVHVEVIPQSLIYQVNISPIGQ